MPLKKATSNLVVPILDNEASYEKWKNDIDLWCHLTSLKPAQRAGTIHLSLTGRARDATSQILTDDLKKIDGVKTLLAKLDDVFLPEKDLRRYLMYNDLHNLRREPHTTIRDFVIVFEGIYFKIKQENLNLPDPVTAYILLSACRLAEDKVHLVMSAIRGDINYANTKAALLRVFGNDTVSTAGSTAGTAGSSSTGVADQVVYNAGDKREHKGEEILYASGQRSFRGRGRFISRGAYKGRYQNRTSIRHTPLGQTCNPRGSDGKPSRCNICKSIYHWARDCRMSFEKTGNAAYKDRLTSFSMFVGCASAQQKHMGLQDLVTESRGYAILDSGCATTVCGDQWLSGFMNNLSDDERSQIRFKPSTQTFTFGDGKTVISQRQLTLPCWMGGVQGEVTTDVVTCNIPLLLSRRSMKAAGMVLDFKKDDLTINGRQIKLKVTKSGHYALPITL